MIYAQIDNNNVVVGLSDLAGEVVAGNMVQVANYDFDLLGRLYNPATGEFGDRQPVEEVEQQPTDMEILTAKVDYVSMVVEGLVLNV